MKLQALNLNKMLNFNKKRAVHRLKSTLNRFFLYIFNHQNRPQWKNT